MTIRGTPSPSLLQLLALIYAAARYLFIGDGLFIGDERYRDERQRVGVPWLAHKKSCLK